MNPIQRLGGFVVLFTVVFFLTGCVSSTGTDSSSTTGPQWETSLAWQDAYVGSPSPAGRHAWSAADGVLTLTGAGVGLERWGDQCQFAYINRPAGDVEVIVRLRDFSGGGLATAGIMVRGASWAPDGPMAAVFYRAGDNSVSWLSRLPGAGGVESQAGTRIEDGVWVSTMVGGGQKQAPTLWGSGIGLAKNAPLWLRLVRVGDNVAMYKSRDGRLWSMISNGSGGPMEITGPLRVGLFCNSAQPDKTVDAVFDNIQIGDPHLRYRTSLVGNSGGTGWHNHVSNSLPAMWVAPDGTCYTSSYWDEGGQPVTSYRDGKLHRPLPIPTPQSGFGGITGDARFGGDGRYNLYAATNGTITVLDPEAADFAPRAMTLSVDLLDRKAGNCVVSGMASNGNELFVADGRENLIRVVSLRAEKLYRSARTPETAIDWTPEGLSGRFVIEPRRATPTDMAVVATEPVEEPEGDVKYAPAIVYQTQRLGEDVTYTFPGLTPGGTYTFRVHLAEFVKRPAHANPKSRSISFRWSFYKNVTIGEQRIGADGGFSINVAEAAGGPLRPLVADLHGHVADDKGNLAFRFMAHGGNFSPLFGAIGAGPGVCGIEVLDADGQRVTAVNCGGPAVGEFKGETEDLVERSFAFERPGVMVFDKRGWLWILQRPAKDGDGTITAPATVKAYATDGKFTGRQITDLVNPNGLAYDPVRDELLVGENLPDMNVRFYGDLSNNPTLARTFGEKGGIYAGSNPGLVYDPEAGGYARFIGINGLGVDAKGNLYVGGGVQGSDLRMFTPDGQLGWMMNSQMFCSTYDFDPWSDGMELYGTYNHMRLDLDKTAPGSEQRYVGYNWDLRRFGEPVRPGNSQAILRRLGPRGDLFMFTSDQGNVGNVYIFRYEMTQYVEREQGVPLLSKIPLINRAFTNRGMVRATSEIAIPCGAIRGDMLWIDLNGDGKETPDEVTKMAFNIQGCNALVVDSRGDLWTTGTTHDPEGAIMRRMFFKGVNDKGVPVYSGQEGDYEQHRFPDEGGVTRPWNTTVRMDYDADRDVMIAYYPAEQRRNESNVPPLKAYLARYDNWSTGNRTATWKTPGLTPYHADDAEFFMYETRIFPYSGYMGMQMVGDYVFMAYLFGEVHVYDLATGKLAEILSIGPEVSGFTAWEDAAMGLRAFKRQNGEYLILTENSGWAGKNNLFRWTPERE